MISPSVEESRSFTTQSFPKSYIYIRFLRCLLAPIVYHVRETPEHLPASVRLAVVLLVASVFFHTICIIFLEICALRSQSSCFFDDAILIFVLCGFKIRSRGPCFRFFFGSLCALSISISATDSVRYSQFTDKIFTIVSIFSAVGLCYS